MKVIERSEEIQMVETLGRGITGLVFGFQPSFHAVLVTIALFYAEAVRMAGIPTEDALLFIRECLEKPKNENQVQVKLPEAKS